MTNQQYKFSVAMSIYKSDVPADLKTALESIVNQTLPPDEIVIVADGPIPAELEAVVKAVDYGQTQLTFLPQEVNRGLGAALRIAVEHARYDYVARMDSDDISLPDRFEKQMKCFREDSALSIVGGMITEFVDTPDNVMGRRILPLEDKDIKEYMKSRSGLNHVTVIFKKDDLLRAGSYLPDFKQEDYYLWARMMEAGCKFGNIPDIVVNVRSGRNQFARRGGMAYFKDVLAFNRWMKDHHLISLPRMIYNILVRGCVQFLMPNSLRTWIYQHLLRQK